MKISELPEEVRELAIKYSNETKGGVNYTDSLGGAFYFDETKEGFEYWDKWRRKEAVKQEPKHYDNSKGSLYKFCEDHELNSYEFDIIKRVMRCRKKGLFLEDLEKTKFAIDLYIKEQLEKNK
jgi:hypothetical protein